ncbi:MAG: 30S ribosomal protein S4 [Lentisphaerae bacterium GWF2_52_8]|nr:MAG: 30S ribosomal protein S4 [Lentisphaerae bacterium GWF2_52_8]
MPQARAKHKLCRRLGYCIWNQAKCPSAKRPYPAGQHGKTARKKKLSGYAEMLMEKQKLKAHYGLIERQLVLAYEKAKKGEGLTDAKLISALETRLDAVVYHSGMAPTIFAAKQFVTHRHILVDGQIVDRPSCHIKPGQVISINTEKSPSIAETAKTTNISTPPYIEFDREQLKVTLTRMPLAEEIPVQVSVIRVVEYYAR